MLGLKGMQIEQRAHEVMAYVAQLEKDFGRFRDDFDVIGKHLGHAQSKYSDAERRLDRFETKLERAAESEVAAVEPQTLHELPRAQTPPRQGVAALARDRLRFAEVADQPARHDDLALAGQEVVRERDRPAAVGDDLGLDLVLALGDPVQPRDAPRLSELSAVVVRFVLEEEWHDPLRDQVAPVDAREALGDHGAHAELRGSERRARGSILPVVVPRDDEASAPTPWRAAGTPCPGAGR